MRNHVIKGITIDLWGTILLDSPAADERYRRERLVRIAKALAERGIEVPVPALARGYEESRGHLARIWRTRRDIPVERHVALLLQAVDGGLPGLLDTESLAAVTRAYASPAVDAPPAVDPGAASALRELAERGIRVCLLSNTLRTPGAVLRRILDGAGLLDIFAGMVFSDECGVRKPDPAIFHMALKHLGLAAQYVAHVGDDARLDVEGARWAGLRVIQITGASLTGHLQGDTAPDASIVDLSELPDAVDRLAMPRRPRNAPPTPLTQPVGTQ